MRIWKAETVFSSAGGRTGHLLGEQQGFGRAQYNLAASLHHDGVVETPRLAPYPQAVTTTVPPLSITGDGDDASNGNMGYDGRVSPERKQAGLNGLAEVIPQRRMVDEILLSLADAFSHDMCKV